MPLFLVEQRNSITRGAMKNEGALVGGERGWGEFIFSAVTDAVIKKTLQMLSFRRLIYL